MFVIRQIIFRLDVDYKIFKFPEEKGKCSKYHSIFRYRKINTYDSYYLKFNSYLIMYIQNLEEILINNYNGKKFANKSGNRGEIRFETREDAEKVIEFLNSVYLAEKLKGTILI